MCIVHLPQREGLFVKSMNPAIGKLSWWWVDRWSSHTDAELLVVGLAQIPTSRQDIRIQCTGYAGSLTANQKIKHFKASLTSCQRPIIESYILPAGHLWYRAAPHASNRAPKHLVPFNAFLILSLSPINRQMQNQRTFVTKVETALHKWKMFSKPSLSPFPCSADKVRNLLSL